ncbi:MAG: helix-turn-helix transcriptional regulator [Polyangiaceae bacterium]|nr:helix-turn-helix transcriptional regulator [Polyangiaceae bacterium]
MSTGKSLTPEQNARVREAVRKLLQQNDNSQTKVAPLLGVEQATLSRFVSGQQGTSLHVAWKVAEFLHIDPLELIDPHQAVLSARGRSATHDPRFPSRPAAEAAARILGCTDEDVLEAVEAHDSAVDPGDVYWVNEFLRARDRRRRRGVHASPASSETPVETPRSHPRTRRAGKG